MVGEREKTQKKFIHLLLINKEMVAKWLDSPLEIKHFDIKYRPILKSVEEAYGRNSLLTLDTFLSSIRPGVTKTTESEQEVTFNSCKIPVVKEDDFFLLQNSIIESYVIENSVHSIQKFNKDYKNTNSVTAVKKLISDLEGVVDVAKEEDVQFIDLASYGKGFIKHLEDIHSGKIKENERIECGIKEIDETMITGFAPGTLTLFCSDVGGFKSTIMLNVALNVWQKGHAVLFVPLEMPSEQMFGKVLAREARVDAEKISKKQLTSEELQKIKKVQDMLENTDPKFFMLKAADRISVKFIRRQIERYYDLFKPKLIVVDYISNLIPDTPRYGRNDLEIGDMLKDLRAMGFSMGFSIVSGAQLGRDALKRIRVSGANSDRQILHSEDIRGSHEFSADADNIYAQVPSPSDPYNGLDIYVIKARNGKKTFPDGGAKATLEVSPEFSLIRSDGGSMAGEDDSIVSKEYDEFEEELNSLSIDSADYSDVVDW